MLERISARFSRKRIKATSATPLRTEASGKAFEPADRLVPPSWLTERSGEVRTASASQLEQARIEYSMVGYQASDPYGDAHIFEVHWLVHDVLYTLRSVSFAMSGTRGAETRYTAGGQHRPCQTFVCSSHFCSTYCSGRQLPSAKHVQRAAATDRSSGRCT